MNRTNHLTVKREIKMSRKRRERRDTILKRRRIALAGTVFITSLLFIYAVNFLFSNDSKSHALEGETTIVKKEVKLEDIQISKDLASKKTNDIVAIAELDTVQKKQSIYNEKIPMPKEHQEYLYQLCEERGLDYKKTLAVIKHESVFDVNAVNKTNDYGYFQINLMNHEDLSQKLGTPNKPLDPFINMQWGTYMLSDLYSYWKEEGYTGEQLDKAVWSSYNRGKNGFRKNGYATEYTKKMKEAIQDINHVM